MDLPAGVACEFALGVDVVLREAGDGLGCLAALIEDKHDDVQVWVSA